MSSARIIALNIAAALAGITLGALLFLTCERGNGDNDSLPTAADRRIDNVRAFLPLAVERYALGGAGSLYEMMSLSVQQKCTLEQFRAALEGTPAPSAFRSLDEVTVAGDVATARLVLITAQGDVGATWRLELLQTGTVRILEVPGSEECRA
jgi:hypothetical protein